MDPKNQPSQPEQIQPAESIVEVPAEPTFEQLAPIMPPEPKSHLGTIFGIFFVTMLILGITGGGAWYYLSMQIQPGNTSPVTLKTSVTPTAGASAQTIATAEEVNPSSVPLIVEAEQLNEDFKELDLLLSTL